MQILARRTGLKGSGFGRGYSSRVLGLNQRGVRVRLVLQNKGDSVAYFIFFLQRRLPYELFGMMFSYVLLATWEEHVSTATWQVR